LILVAAIAAGVYVFTASSVQSKAISVGHKAKGSVATAFTISEIYGFDQGDNNDIDYLFIRLILASGSDGIKLNDLLLKFALIDEDNTMLYGGERSCTPGLLATGNTTEYYVQYLRNGTGHSTGYLQTGDVVILCFKTTQNFVEGEELKVEFIPTRGQLRQMTMKVPDIITKPYIPIFP
jgi:archaellin